MVPNTVFIVNRFIVFSLLLGSFGLVTAVAAQDQPAAQSPTPTAKIDFARDIQPILSENCYYCHGPDQGKRKAGIRLDVEEDALASFEPGSSDGQ